MAGRPFKFGRFAHSLRVRLMREHLGVNVDALDEEGLKVYGPMESEHDQKLCNPEGIQQIGKVVNTTQKVEHVHHTRIMDATKSYLDGIKKGRLHFSHHLPIIYVVVL